MHLLEELEMNEDVMTDRTVNSGLGVLLEFNFA